jgi:hypothetical protein
LNLKANLSTMKLNASFRHIATHLDDLKVASHKVSEIEHLIKVQEWKRLHTISHNTYSILVYVFDRCRALYCVQIVHLC